MLCSKSGSQRLLDKEVCYIPLNFKNHVIVEEWPSYYVAKAYHIAEWFLVIALNYSVLSRISLSGGGHFAL